jgi:hypothetical protein
VRQVLVTPRKLKYAALLRLLHQRRAPHANTTLYRDELVKTAIAADAKDSDPRAGCLWVLFIDPCSPHFDNLHMALARTIDRTSHIKADCARG